MEECIYQSTWTVTEEIVFFVVGSEFKVGRVHRIMIRLELGGSAVAVMNRYVFLVREIVLLLFILNEAFLLFSWFFTPVFKF